MAKKDIGTNLLDNQKNPEQVVRENETKKTVEVNANMPTDAELDADLAEDVKVIEPTTKAQHVQPRQETQFEKDLFAEITKKPLGQHVEGRTIAMTDKAKEDYANQYNKKQQEELAEKNKKFGTYSFDNTAFDVKNKELLAIDDSQLTPEQIKRKRKAEAKIEANQRDYEKFMDFVRQYDKYNQYGGAFNYDQFTSSVDPKVIRAAAKALGVKGLSNIGIATEELYNAARKEMQKKYDVAYQERQAIQAEKKKAEENLLANKEEAEKNADRLKVLKEFRTTLKNNPTKLSEGQARELQVILKDHFGKEVKLDDIMGQQTTGALIDVLIDQYGVPKDYFVASGLMLPEGYEKASPLDKWLDGDDKERAEYELRFAQRRDQRNRFAQSLVDLAGITSRMIAASGGAQMEPYKNDMYDKFREDMKAARKRYDERMGEIRQREIDAEKEAYARIREREKAAQEQANADRAYNFQVSRAEAQDKHNADRLALQKQELNDNRAYRNKNLDIEKQKADNYKAAHEQGVKQNIRLGLENEYADYNNINEYEKLYDFMLRMNEQYKKEAPDGIYGATEIAYAKNKRDNKIIEDLATAEADNIEDWGKESWYEGKETHLKEAKEGVKKLVDKMENANVDRNLIRKFINDNGLTEIATLIAKEENK